jgi:hypothetical protein
MRAAPAGEKVHDVHDRVFIIFTRSLAQALSHLLELAQYRVRPATLVEQPLCELAKLADAIGAWNSRQLAGGLGGLPSWLEKVAA